MKQGKWADTQNGTIVQDDSGSLWRIVGYIDRPVVILNPIKEAGNPMQQADQRGQLTLVMGSAQADKYHPLKRGDPA